MTHFLEFQDTCRARLLPYTRQAWRSIRGPAHPTVLDIGCGSGVVSRELVRLGADMVIAVDIDRSGLRRLRLQAERDNCAECVFPIRASLFELPVAPGAFDIIWAEGAVADIGFQRALKEWRSYLAPDGWVVIHDDADQERRKLAQVSEAGFRLIDHFSLGSQVWWNDYYLPLSREMDSLAGPSREAGPEEHAAIASVHRQLQEFERDPNRFQSIFVIAQRMDR